MDRKTLSSGEPAITISGNEISLGSSQIQITMQNFLLTLPLYFVCAGSLFLTIKGKIFMTNHSRNLIRVAELISVGRRFTISETSSSLGTPIMKTGTSSIMSLSKSSINRTSLDQFIKARSGFLVMATLTDQSSSSNSDASIAREKKLGTATIFKNLCLGIHVFMLAQLISLEKNSHLLFSSPKYKKKRKYFMMELFSSDPWIK